MKFFNKINLYEENQRNIAKLPQLFYNEKPKVNYFHKRRTFLTINNLKQ